jgi:hypothetical protein
MVCAVKRSFRSVRFDVRRSICSEALRRCRPRKLCSGPAKVTVFGPQRKASSKASSTFRSTKLRCCASLFRLPLPATRFLLRFLPWHLNHSIGSRNSVRSSHDARALRLLFLYTICSKFLARDDSERALRRRLRRRGDRRRLSLRHELPGADRKQRRRRGQERQPRGQARRPSRTLDLASAWRLHQSAVSVRLAARSPRAAAASTRAKREVHGKDPPPLRHFPCYRRPIRRTSPRPC